MQISREAHMERHIEILGWLHIGLSILSLLIGIAAFFFMTALAFLPDIDEEASAILGVIGVIAGLFFMIISAPGIIGGIGLLKRQNWARILIIILGFIQLINFPIGTALGIYTLVILLREETTQYFPGA
jgi:hypothetical protein